MAYSIVYTKSADRQVYKIGCFIARDNPIRAISFVRDLQESIEKLSHNPHIYQAFGKYRRLVFGNYIALYSISSKLKRITVHFVSEGHVNWQKFI